MAELMSATHQTQNRLLSEHFGFHPITLLDDVINMVNELVNQAVDGIEATLKGNNVEHLGFSVENNAEQLAQPGQILEEVASLEIEEGVHKLESLLNSTVDRSLDIMEVFVARNFLSISNVPGEEDLESWVLLEHYRDIDMTLAKDARVVDSDRLLGLARKARETEKLHLLLKDEAARNDAILDQLKTLSGSGQVSADGRPNSALAFLMQNHDQMIQNSTGRLTKHMQYLLPRVESIRSTLAQTRPQLATISEPTISEAARTREAYLQEQSTKAMAKAGVTPHSNPAQGAVGRHMSEHEIQALEVVAADLKASQ